MASPTLSRHSSDDGFIASEASDAPAVDSPVPSDDAESASAEDTEESSDDDLSLPSDGDDSDDGVSRRPKHGLKRVKRVYAPAPPVDFDEAAAVQLLEKKCPLPGGGGAAGGAAAPAPAPAPAGIGSAPPSLQATLHPHQAVGVQWMAAHYAAGTGCILADVMGLGKTVQTIGMLAAALDAAPAGGRCGPFLVVAPLSVCDGWRKEIERFCPALNVQLYTGSGQARAEVRDIIAQHVTSQPAAARKDPKLPFHVLLTSYELLLSDAPFLGRFRWRAAVFDEGHRLKNVKTATYQCVVHEYVMQRRYILSGTPVNNVLSELGALLHLVVPDAMPLGAVDSFEALFSGEDGAGVVAAKQADLRTLLARVMLRRSKGTVNLPALSEVLVRCPMPKMQHKWYMAALNGNLRTLTAANAPGLSNVVSNLKRAAAHPYVRVVGVCCAGLLLMTSVRACVCLQLFPGAEPGPPFNAGDHLFRNAAKMFVLDKLLNKLLPGGHSVLLFSQSSQVLDVIQDYLCVCPFPSCL